MNNVLFNKIKYELQEISYLNENEQKMSITDMLFKYLSLCDDENDKLTIILSFYSNIKYNFLNAFFKGEITSLFDSDYKMKSNFNKIIKNDILLNLVLDLCDNDVLESIYNYGINNKLFKDNLLCLKKIENACVVKGILKSEDTSLILNSVLLSKIITSKKIILTKKQLYNFIHNINNRYYIGKLKIDKFDNYKKDFIYNIKYHDKIVNCDLESYKVLINNIQKKENIINEFIDLDINFIKMALTDSNNV